MISGRMGKNKEDDEEHGAAFYVICRLCTARKFIIALMSSSWKTSSHPRQMTHYLVISLRNLVVLPF